MNESPLDPSDLTPAQEESVRRLLAEARASEPMPDDVRSRLDDVLRELSLASSQATRPMPMPMPTATVVDLAARRGSRAKNLLIAAAAVVAVGVAVPQVLQGSLSANDSAGSSADYESATDAGSGGDTMLRDDPARGAAPEAQDETDTQAAPGSASSQFTVDSDLPRIRPRAFVADVEAVRDEFDGERAALADQAYRTACLAKVDLGGLNSTQIPVRYANSEALLVLGPIANGTQRASVYVCGELVPRRTALLDAR